MGSEAAGLDEASGYVVGDGSKAQRDAAEVFQAAVGGLAGSVAGVWVIEVGEDIARSPLERCREGSEFGESVGERGCDGMNHGLESCFAELFLGFLVGDDHALVDAPSRLDFRVLVRLEHGIETFRLPVGEEQGSGAQHSAHAVERISFPASVAGGFVLDTLPAGARCAPANSSSTIGNENASTRCSTPSSTRRSRELGASASA